MTTALGTPPPGWVRKMIEQFERNRLIDEHERRKGEWPWYGRFQHWLFVSWRCEACKAARVRDGGDERGIK